jgi:hypothetical protein
MEMRKSATACAVNVACEPLEVPDNDDGLPVSAWY